MDFHQELVETWGMMKLRCATMECNLPETDMAPENNPLEKEIPIGNHHFLGAIYVSFRDCRCWGLCAASPNHWWYIMRFLFVFWTVFHVNEIRGHGFNKFFRQIHCSIGPGTVSTVTSLPHGPGYKPPRLFSGNSWFLSLVFQESFSHIS